jgi:hypothetical protein
MTLNRTEGILSDSEIRSFEGFQAADRTFFLTGYHLKLVRRWRRESPGSATEPELTVVISGLGISDTDKVRVVGADHVSSEFDLCIRSDHASLNEWHEIGRLSALAAGDGDSPERKRRELQSEILLKAPPTAVLLFNGAWSLECRIPDEVLEQFSKDMTAGEVDTVDIGVNWVCGLIENPYGHFGQLLQNLFTRATWGVFTIAGETSPEPLWGHISVFEWKPGSKPIGRKPPEADNLGSVCDVWLKAFEETSKESGEIWRTRIKSPLHQLAKQATEWCRHEHGSLSAGYLGSTLNYALEFLHRLDEALHQQDGPFAKEKSILWQHRDIGSTIKTTSASQRESFIDSTEIRMVVERYLANAWLNNDYLDWVLVDALSSATIIATTEAWRRQRDGMAYILADGVRWKIWMWKAILRPLGWFIAWGLPAILCYFIAQRSLTSAIIIGAVWYGLGLVGVILNLWSRAYILITTGQPAGRRFGRLVDEMARAYVWLAGPVMHINSVRRAFDQAAERGVFWDQQIFYLLDRVAKDNPKLWTNSPGYISPLHWI